MNNDGKSSYHLQLSWGFQDLTDSGIILRFCGIYSFAVPNKTPITLLINIFKQSMSRKISLSGCTFGPKWFYSSGTGTDLSTFRGQANFDVGISICDPSSLRS